MDFFALFKVFQIQVGQQIAHANQNHHFKGALFTVYGDLGVFLYVNERSLAQHSLCIHANVSNGHPVVHSGGSYTQNSSSTTSRHTFTNAASVIFRDRYTVSAPASKLIYYEEKSVWRLSPDREGTEARTGSL